MDHQPGPGMRCTCQLRHPMLEQGHLTPRHCPEEQRSCQDTASVQTGHEFRQIPMVRSLVHQIDRGALASEGGKPDRGLRCHRMAGDQMLANGF